MSNENEIDDLRGQVGEMQQQLSQVATAARMPVLDMSQMMTSREYHRQLVESRKASTQPVRQPAQLAGSIVPRSFELVLGHADAALETEIRSDMNFRFACDHYAKAREGWWAALSLGDRRAIDQAGWALTVRYAEARDAVFAVAIRGLRADSARQKAQIESLEAQKTRLETEVRDHKQRADAFEIAHMTAPPPGPPKVEVTVAVPDAIAIRLAPSAGTTVEYDGDGKVVGTRPRDIGQ